MALATLTDPNPCLEVSEAEMAALRAASPQAWMDFNGMVTNKGDPMEFRDRLWMHSILVDMSPDLVVKKAAQIGISTCEIFKVLHRCTHDKITCIYILPTDSDVNQFVSSKVNPIMEYNHIETHGKDSIGQKIIGQGGNKSFLFFKGSWMERAAIMLDCDFLVFDEFDHCDPSVLETYRSRTKASKLAWQHRFSTPTAPNHGIDLEFDSTNQMHWFVKCPSCNHEDYLDWPDHEEKPKGIIGNVDFTNEIYVCALCHKFLPKEAIQTGRWVRKYREGARGQRNGYWISQMMFPRLTCAELIAEEARTSKQYFLNYCLGKAYAGTDITISRGMITACLSGQRPERSNMVMGIDVGKRNHFYVIGNGAGIHEVGVIDYRDDDEDKGYNRIFAKMQEHDIRTCVIDGNPRTNESQKFAEAFPYKVYLCYFRPQEKEVLPVAFDDERHIVNADRQRTLDQTIERLSSGKVGLFIDPYEPACDILVNHWSNLFLKEETTRDGEVKLTWDAGGKPDHMALATNYFNIALGRYGMEEINLKATSEEPVGTVAPGLFENEGEDAWYF
jgi:hypothetical protein